MAAALWRLLLLAALAGALGAQQALALEEDAADGIVTRLSRSLRTSAASPKARLLHVGSLQASAIGLSTQVARAAVQSVADW